MRVTVRNVERARGGWSAEVYTDGRYTCGLDVWTHAEVTTARVRAGEQVRVHSWRRGRVPGYNEVTAWATAATRGLLLGVSVA